MNISRFLVGALLVGALPALSQPETRPANNLPYRLVSPEEAARLGAPFSLKLHLPNATIGEALAELQKQTGVGIDASYVVGGVMNEKFAFDIETNSVLDAATTIFKTARANLKLVEEQSGWSVRPKNFKADVGAPTSGTPSFRVRVEHINFSETSSVTLGKTPKREKNEFFTLGMRMLTDPKLALVGTPRLQIARVEDDRGKSLRFDDPFRMISGMGSQMDLRLLTPTEGSQTIARLEGKAVCVLVSKRDLWEVPDVLQAKDAKHTFSVAGQNTQVVIENAEQVGDIVRLRLAVRSLLGAEFDERRNPLMSGSLFSSYLRLSDANGQVFRSNGFGSSGGAGEMRMKGEFAVARSNTPSFIRQNGKLVRVAPPAPAPLVGPIKMVFDVPVEFVQTEVPFSFSDLPLP